MYILLNDIPDRIRPHPNDILSIYHKEKGVMSNDNKTDV